MVSNQGRQFIITIKVQLIANKTTNTTTSSPMICIESSTDL